MKANLSYEEAEAVVELITSEIRRKYQKRIDEEIESYLSGSGWDGCELRGIININKL
jgi:hypothetical protein